MIVPGNMSMGLMASFIERWAGPRSLKRLGATFRGLLLPGNTITLYGIPNCDTVRRARAWLVARGVGHRFHDFKKAGVRVVIAHCATLGHALDIDKASAPKVLAFDLFARLMDERAHESLLLGDLSAVFQINRRVAVQKRIVERTDWHPRLLHGSDYPLPGLVPLTRPQRLADHGLLDSKAVPVLESIRAHNPLLFDFVLKRSVTAGSAKLAAAVFETWKHFA